MRADPELTENYCPARARHAEKSRVYTGAPARGQCRPPPNAFPGGRKRGQAEMMSDPEGLRRGGFNVQSWLLVHQYSLCKEELYEVSSPFRKEK